MNERQIDIAKRLVAGAQWEWQDGMLSSDGWRANVAYDDGDVQWVSDCGLIDTTNPADSDAIPDLSDPATGGALVGMLPGWYEIESSTPDNVTVRLWDVEDEDGGSWRFHGSTLAEAAALAWLATGETIP